MNEIITFHIRDEHIRLGQALKAAGLAETGVDAKYAVQDGLVKVNGRDRVRAANGYQITGAVRFQKLPAS